MGDHAMTKRPKRGCSFQSCLACVVMAGLIAIGSSAWGMPAWGMPAQETAPHSPASTTVTPGAGKDQASVHTVSTDMVPIMALLLNHGSIRFTIEKIPRGARTITTSKDAEIVRAIRLHAREMKIRVQQGNNIRPNDPIFIEIFRRHKEISDMITDIPGGVSEDETSQNSQVVILIRAHAQVVAGFVRQGLEATHKNTPLPKGYHPNAGAAPENSHL